MSDFAQARARMVEEQLRSRGIEDERVLEAMGSIPREIFVPEDRRELSYADGALPIGFGQTISQPAMVAEICQALELDGHERVLEIGTGSGYSAAVLARLCSKVRSIERIPELTESARAALDEAGIENVECLVADGSVGSPEGAPWDAIAVHAGAPEVPPALVEQLGPGGRLVVPVAFDGGEMLTRVTVDRAGKASKEDLGPCRFVPLIGEEGFDA